MSAIERQRHVAAEREPADDGFLRTDVVEQGGDVADRQRLAIERAIGGIIGLAMAAHVPEDQSVMPRQRLDLLLPHRRCRGITMGEDERRSVAMDLVIDLHAVTIDFWHRVFSARFPFSPRKFSAIPLPL